MKRIGAVCAMLVLVSAVPAAAQGYTGSVYASGGISLPMGDFGDYAKTGWMGSAGALYNLSDRVWVQGDVYLGSNKHSDFEGDKTQLLAGMAHLGYSLVADGKIIPYVMAGVGMMSHKYQPETGDSESDSKVVVGGGAGLYFPMGSYGFYVEGHYMSREGTQVVPIMFGVQLNFGKK